MAFHATGYVGRDHEMQIISTHKNADFDGVASVFAASLLYPEAIPVLPKSINPNVRYFLSIHKDLFPSKVPKEIKINEVRRVVIVDAAGWERLEGLGGLRENKAIDVHVWDHHEVTPNAIEADWSCCESLGAATTLFVRDLEKKKIDITSMQATLFLAGIYEDTGNLTFPSTTADDAWAVSFLLRNHGDLNIIKTFLRPVYGPKQKDVLFEMLKSAERTRVNGYMVSMKQLEIKGHTPGLAIVIEMYRDILNVDAAFGIFNDLRTNRCMVIGRSSTDDLDVGAIMRSIGGGGHPNAGSALLKSVNPNEIPDRIMDLIKGNKGTSVQIGDLMSFPVDFVSPETPMKEAALILRDKGCTGLPVVKDEEVVGIISRRDFKKMKKNVLDALVKAFMSTKIITIDPGRSVTKAAELMVKNDIGRIPVLENGKLIGIITRSDTMRYYYDLLPD